MAKRFTDTDLWKNQRWFRKLPPLDKVAFCYIKDQCSHAGIWKIDCSDLVEDIGLTSFDINKFISSVNIEFDKISGKKINKERLKIVNKTLLWITGFIQFQYEGKDSLVNWEANPVRTALMVLDGLSTLTEGLDKGYIRLKKPLLKGWQTPKDKDKEEKKGSMRENKNGKNFHSPIIGEKFDKKIGRVLMSDGTWQKLGEDQKKLLKMGQLIPQTIIKGTIN